MIVLQCRVPPLEDVPVYTGRLVEIQIRDRKYELSEDGDGLQVRVDGQIRIEPRVGNVITVRYDPD